MSKQLTLRKLIELAKSININENVLDLPLLVRGSEKSLFSIRPYNFEGMHVENSKMTNLDTYLVMDFVGQE